MKRKILKQTIYYKWIVSERKFQVSVLKVYRDGFMLIPLFKI
jgi:hypothetical protein